MWGEKNRIKRHTERPVWCRKERPIPSSPLAENAESGIAGFYYDKQNNYK